MMMKKNYMACLLALFSLGAGLSCKKVIEVDLNNTTPWIVIEGEITNMAGPDSQHTG